MSNRIFIVDTNVLVAGLITGEGKSPTARVLNEDAMENLARHIIRASFSQERMTYIPKESKVVYQNDQDDQIPSILEPEGSSSEYRIQTRPELSLPYCGALSRPQYPVVTFPLTPKPVSAISFPQRREFLSPHLLSTTTSTGIYPRESKVQDTGKKAAS